MGGTSSKTLKELVENLVVSEVSSSSSSESAWDELWTMENLSAEKLQEELTPSLVRKLLTKQPGNTKKLFKQAIAQLTQIIETPTALYFPQALNCIRVLTRILPFMIEGAGKLEYLQGLLWSVQVSKRPSVSRSANVSPERGVSVSSESKKNANKDDKRSLAVQTSHPLAEILLSVVLNLCFLPELTIPELNKIISTDSMDSRGFKMSLVWRGGVGCIDKVSSTVVTSQFDSHRIAVLRLLIAGSCSDVYLKSSELDCCKNPWLSLACIGDTPSAEVLFYSLINTVLGFEVAGWGFAYSSQEVGRQLLEVSLDSLLVLLNFGIPFAECVARFDADETIRDWSSIPGYNIHRFLLSGIRKHDEFAFIHNGFIRLFQYIHSNRASAPSLNYVESKLLLLLWKLLDENEDYFHYFIEQVNVSDSWTVILLVMLLRRKDSREVNLMYLCSILLLKLTSDRSFCVALNKTCTPTILPLPDFVQGAFSDLIIIVIHKVMVSGSEAFFPLYGTLLTAICNMSPYLKSASATSSIKLVNLFHMLCSPKFLFDAESNHTLLSLLLQTFNNVLQYQYTGNTSLVYALICRKDDLYDLEYLTLSAAIKGFEEATTTGASTVLMSTDDVIPSSKGGNDSSDDLEYVLHSGLVLLDEDDEYVGETSPPRYQRQPLTVIQQEAAEPLTALHSTCDAITAEASQVQAAVVESLLDETQIVSTPNELQALNSDGTVNTDAQTNSENGQDVEQVSIVQQANEGETSEVNVALDSEASTAAIPVISSPSEPSRNVEPLQAEPDVRVKQSDDVDDGSAFNEPPVFTPTNEWLEKLKASLPLNTIIKMLNHLGPLVEHQASHGGSLDYIMELIDETMMVGILPVPHPIVVRKHTSNKHTAMWSTQFVWELIYHSNSTLPCFNGKYVSLFKCQQ